jgi:hypothetical protein
MSVRTLQRRLKEDGTSFAEVQRSAIAKQAVELLRHGGLPSRKSLMSLDTSTRRTLRAPLPIGSGNRQGPGIAERVHQPR